ncbi:MAG: hypothetical protein WAK10_01500 [Methanoregula sp.]
MGSTPVTYQVGGHFVQIVEMTLFSALLKELDCGGFTEGSRYKDKNIHLG